MALVVLLGASGSGKTAVADAIKARHPDKVDVFHFDSIGVPSISEMAVSHGSPEAWQRAMTIEWFGRLAVPTGGERLIVFEGQTRLSFLDEAAVLAGGLRYIPILIDCDDETRTRRLTVDRGQPELANRRMMDWARSLREEACRAGCEILDTSRLTPDECISRILQRLRSSRHGSSGR